MGVNHILYNGRTLIDLRADTVTASTLLKGVTAHDKAGNQITGTYEPLDISAETADYTAKLETQNTKLLQIVNLLKAKFAVPGNLQNKTVTPSASQQVVIADSGYDGLSKVTVNAIPQSILDAEYQRGYDAAFEICCPYKQELEYIQCNGNSWVDTEISPHSENVEYEYSWIEPTLQSGCTIFGSTNASSSTNKWSATHYKNSTTSLYSATGGKDACCAISNISANTIMIGKTVINNGTITRTQNGTTSTTTYTGSIQNGVSIYLFADHKSDGSVIEKCNYVKLLYWRMYDGGVLVRDFIPVLDWDDVPCLYDKVKRKMYYNAGTGEFTAGEAAA